MSGRRWPSISGDEDPSDTAIEGERSRAEPDAQPELGARPSPMRPPGISRRIETDQDRNATLRPQLHLGAVSDATRSRSTVGQDEAGDPRFDVEHDDDNEQSESS